MVTGEMVHKQGAGLELSAVTELALELSILSVRYLETVATVTSVTSLEIVTTNTGTRASH